MYYYKARMYSPTLGRFMQPDPIGYGDGMNLYAYVANDPVNGTDPTGMMIVYCRYTYHETPEGYPIIVTAPRCSYLRGPEDEHSSVRERDICRGLSGRGLRDCLTDFMVDESDAAPQSVVIDDSCKGVPAAADPRVQNAALEVLSASLNGGPHEYARLLVPVPRSSSGWLPGPLFRSSSSEPDTLLASDINNAYSQINVHPQMRRLPILIHSHPNYPSPSTVGVADQGFTDETGMTLMAIDKGGVLSCTVRK